ncbi:phage late control D family protein [Chloroflexota bacterium]
MSSGQYISNVVLKIGGKAVEQELNDAVDEIVVDTSLYLPGMFSIRLHDPHLKWVDDASLDIGKEVEITAESGQDTGGETGMLIKGEITALEPQFSAGGKSTMLVRGYDKSHRLHRGKKTRTFLGKKDSDLVSTIAGEVGLSEKADSTTVTYDFILQNNQTNMEFLRARAEKRRACPAGVAQPCWASVVVALPVRA